MSHCHCHANAHKEASSWDSYQRAMHSILDEFKPSLCFEWGSGVSTQIMALHPAVDHVETVENSEKYYRYGSQFRIANITFHYEPDLRKYAGVKGSRAPYDFIFVDGRNRLQCLFNAHKLLNQHGIVMLHDAGRIWYHAGVESYKHSLFVDGGCTAIMTNSTKTFLKLNEIKEKL